MFLFGSIWLTVTLLTHNLVVAFHALEYEACGLTHRFTASVTLWPPSDILPCLVFSHKSNTSIMSHFAPDFPSVSNTCLSHVTLLHYICTTAHLKPISCSTDDTLLLLRLWSLWGGPRAVSSGGVDKHWPSFLGTRPNADLFIFLNTKWNKCNL